MTSDSVCNKHYIVLFESVHIPHYIVRLSSRLTLRYINVRAIIAPGAVISTLEVLPSVV